MNRDLIRTFFGDSNEYLKFLLHLQEIQKVNRESTCFAELTKEDDRFKYLLIWHDGRHVGEYIAPFRASAINVELFNRGCKNIADLLDAYLDADDISVVDPESRPFGDLTWSTANIDPTPGENPYPTESHGKFDRYFPTILNAQTVREIDIGKYLLVLLTAVNSSDVVGYAHLLVAFDKTTHEPRFVVAAEKNDTPGAGLESHFLGGFSGKGHINYGESDDWADIEKFEIRAREIVMKELILCRNEWE